MNDQRGTRKIAHTSYLDTTSISLPPTGRASVQDAIRPGTVATRVQCLQSLLPTNARTSYPSPISIPRGEETRTAFGRRLNKRFGPPALHGMNPDEEPRIGTSYHTFLGLDTPRITHDEHHAIAQYRVKHVRSPGINGQIAPETVIVRHQHDALAPWEVLSRSKRTRSMGRHVLDSETGIRNNTSRRNEQVKAVSSRSSNDINRKYVEHWHQTVTSQPADTIRSETSISTNSTTRRASVRDLFKDYGIEKPPGLASPERSYENQGTSQMKPLRECHVCSRVNSGVSTACSRCSHRLCLQCDTWSKLQDAHHNLGHPDMNISSSRGSKIVEESRLGGHDHDHSSDPRGPPVPIQPQEEVPQSQYQTSNTASNIPRERRVVSSISQASLQASKQDDLVPETPRAMQKLSSIQVPSRVKDSPFLIADALASGRSRPTDPIKAPAGKGHVHGDAHNNRVKQLGEHKHASSSPEGCKCDSPTCLATHADHKPYRHATSCIKKKRHRHAHKGTDQGYAADTSRVEEASHKPSRPHSHASAKRTHQHHQTLKSPSVPSPQITSSAPDRETLEFVACNGYPRTGHQRLGTPVSAGVVGECQHCLHDCHCRACQNTYHNVRCCTHEDHQAIAHKHLTPRRERSIVEKDAQSPTKKGTSFEPTASKPSIFRTSHDHHPKARRESRSSAPPQHFANTSLVQRPGLPKTKTDYIQANVVAKPPTPPPWVYSPRKTSMVDTATSERRNETRRNEPDTAFDARALDERPPSIPDPPRQRRPVSPNAERWYERRWQETNDAFHNILFDNSAPCEPGLSKQSRPGVSTTERCKETRRSDVDTVDDDQALNNSGPRRSRPQKERKSYDSTSKRWKRKEAQYAGNSLAIDPLQYSRSSLHEKANPEQTFPHNQYHSQLDHRESNDDWPMLQSRDERDDNEHYRPSYRPVSRGPIVEKQSRPPSTRPPSTRPPSRMQVSPPGSRRASRRLSALFQLREKNSVPVLNQRLLEHQEELRRLQGECSEAVEKPAKSPPENTMQQTASPDSSRAVRSMSDETQRLLERQEELRRRKHEREEKTETAAKSSLEEQTQQRARKESNKTVRQMPEEPQRLERANSKASSTGMKRWRLRLVERRPSPACVNDEPVLQHTLAEDELITTRQYVREHKLHDDEIIQSRRRVEEHKLADDEVIKGGKLVTQHLLQEDVMAFDGRRSYKTSRETTEQHSCPWKSRLEQDSGSLSIKGVTVLLHLEEREDVIFEADEWRGGQPRLED